MFTHIYLCLPPVYICDVAGENRPTGACFIIEFDLTKVVRNISAKNFL